MNIVKGDTVYIRAGKDAASVSRLPENARGKSMTEQVAAANDNPGIRGEVLKVYPKEGKVLVKGINMVTKHQRPRATSGAGAVQQGGRIQLEAPVPASRVMLVCTNCQKPTRVAIKTRVEKRVTLNGEKDKIVRDRICKHCEQVIAKPTARG